MLVRLLIPLALVAAVLVAAATVPAHRSDGRSACSNVSSARSLAAICRR
ncbi:MAG: hypothetical protein ACYDA3_04395 [Gaiellaceae bacterium]